MDSNPSPPSRLGPTLHARFHVDGQGHLLSLNELARKLGWPFGGAAWPATLAKSLARLRRFPDQEIRFMQASLAGGLMECRVLAAGGDPSAGFLLDVQPAEESAIGQKLPEQERWRYALDNAEDGLWDWSADSSQVYRSARSLSMLGYQPGDVAGSVEAWHALVHPQDRERQSQALSTHLHGGSHSYKVEYRLRHADGSWRWILDRGKVLYWSPDGLPLRVVGTHTDITAYKEMEQRLRERETLLDEAQRIGHIGSWALDLATSKVWWSAEMYRIAGLPPGQDPPDWSAQGSLYAPASYQLFETSVRQALQDGQGFAIEVEMIRPDGERRIVEVASDLLRGETGGVVRLVGAMHDVTEQRRVTETARWRNKLLDRIAAMGRIGGFDLDFENGVFHFTDENYRIHGIEPGTPVTIESLMGRFDEASQRKLAEAIERMTSGQTVEETAEVEYKAGNRERLVLRITANVEHVEGKPRRVTGLTQDITEEREAGERIQQLAHYDTLTGLPNRFLFRERALEAIAGAQRTKSPLALLFIDLDRFKVVNDTLGHAAGDELLKQVSHRLQECVRGRDLIGRQGGDEFMVVLCDLRKPENAARVAEKIIAAVGAPFLLDEGEVQVGCSIGIALLSEDNSELDSLMRSSDTAMYAAKDAGRNTFEFYNDSFFERVHRRGKLEQELRQALARDEFSLVYQPTVSLAPDGGVVGIEALLRWQRPGDELRSPLEFIPIAEETGEIVPIGLWVLVQACRQAAGWSADGLAFTSIAVNVSAMQLRDVHFAERVLEICERTGWPPTRLVLELTESALMHDNEVLRANFSSFEKHGVHLAVDDFGTGFSNLLYLHRFPVRQLKIDRSFVGQMLSDRQVGVLTQAIISLGHAMGLTVIAEGVESEQLLRALRNQGCDQAQGYHLTRPLAAGEMEAWIRARG